ncbi:MAG: tRNA pseudouridine(55) synthase TruB [Spirochaetales bacterium]|nr:tRNA pseudouridine(55) synthase TruB [Spirochaetales bacterium]
MIQNDGLILVNKNKDMTSFQCLSPLKRNLNKKKIGHTGTLDKFASGLLLVLTGPFTRFVPYFHQFAKKYTAVVKMGEETSTFDPEGQITEKSQIPCLDLLEVKLQEFQGAIMQVPPVYSAIHSNGKRAYQLAMAGVNPDLKPRKVIIHDIKLYNYNPPFFTLDVHCSTGTYIRSLARDICREAGSCGHLVELKRTSIGPFCLENAKIPESIEKNDILGFEQFLPKLSGLEFIDIKEDFHSMVMNGFPLKDHFFEKKDLLSGKYYSYKRGEFLVVCEKNDIHWKYHMVLRLG